MNRISVIATVELRISFGFRGLDVEIWNWRSSRGDEAQIPSEAGSKLEPPHVSGYVPKGLLSLRPDEGTSRQGHLASGSHSWQLIYKRILSCALAWFSILSAALAQSPNLTHIIPAAAAPGKSTEVTFFGKNLGGATELWTSFPCEAVLARPNGENEKETGKVTFRLTPAPETQVGIGAVRLATTNGISSLHLFMIDDLPGIAAVGTNKTIAAAQELRPPIAVDGATEPLSFDYFKFAASKGQRVTVDVVAARLGSALDPVVRLLDAKGRELVYCDDEPGAGPDSRFVFKAPAAGDYVIELRDANYQGGASYR